QDLPEPEFFEEMTRDQHGPPSAGVQYFYRTRQRGLFGKLRRRVFATQEPLEHRQHGLQEIAPPQVGDNVLLDAPLVQTDSTIRTYSCTVPEELGTLTERMNMMNNYHYLVTHKSTRKRVTYRIFLKKHRTYCHYVFGKTRLAAVAK